MEIKRSHGRDSKAASSRAFTLVELMVSMAVLSVLGILILTMVSNVSSVTKRTRDQVESYQGARAAFEALTRTISQATLNTYWDYYDSSGKAANESGYSGTPAKYGRQSELHFRSGPTDILFGTSNGGLTRPTHSIFFQIPGGFTSNSTLKQLNNTLNGIGFFLEFGNDDALRPSFLAGDTSIPKRYRYRLLQMQQATENLQIYSSSNGTAWFQNPLGFGSITVNASARPVNVLAENVIALVIIPRLSSTEDPTGAALVKTDYNYDSRTAKSYSATSASGTSMSGTTLHQLPPLVEVIMVVIDETSAQRLAEQNGTTEPDFGQKDLFKTISSSTNVDADIDTLEKNLIDKKLNYRIYRSVVGIRGAKWSAN
jgi:uncharacterized protein (TIGR02599 family)